MKAIRILCVISVALVNFADAALATESDAEPKYVTAPAIGLRVPIAGIKYEALPEALRATCDQIADNEQYTGRIWVFGQAKDAASTYYIVSGYFKRRARDPDRRLYEVLDNGSVFTVRGEKCGGDDAIETFNTRDPNADNDGNVPIRILRELARDLASQTVRAFGGPDQLRLELKNQRIDFNQLSPEVQEAFAPYFDK